MTVASSAAAGRLRILRVILAASVVSTAIHYGDNYLSLERYPQPDWVFGPTIYLPWLVLTAIGLVGYRLYRRDASRLAIACLLVYSVTGISTLGHYLYGAPSDLSPLRNLSIVADGLTGLAVLTFAIASALAARAAPAPR